MKPLKKIGQYEIINTLYARPDYTCYLACGPDDQNYVLKVFDLGLLENASAELKAARQLQDITHPNLVRIIKVERLPKLKIYYYVMECWGKDLRDTIHIKPDPKVALDIIKQVLNGLAELHSHKLTHRDIKPENIFIKNGQVKIGDYGLVKSQRFITQLTTIAGTQGYIAPEVLDGKPYDHRCDIYSTGVVLKELLGDEAPEWIISKAMAEKPADRFQTAEEFIDALTHHKGTKDTKKEETESPLNELDKLISDGAFTIKPPIFQKLDIQRYPPKPEMRGQDNPGVLIKTLQARLDELSTTDDYNAMLPIAAELRKAVVTRFDIYNSRSADALDKEAEIHLKLGNYPKSIELYKASLDTIQKLYGTPTKEMIGCYYNLAEAHRNFSNYQEAKTWYSLALSSSDKIFKGLPQNAIIRNNLAGVYYLLKEHSTALNFYQEALTINENRVSRISEPVAINLYNMALTYEAMENKGAAEPLYKQARETLVRFLERPGNKPSIPEPDKQRILAI